MKKYIAFLTLCIVLFGCKEDSDTKIVKTDTSKEEESSDGKLEVLLIGTFHYNNFNPENNLDVAKEEVIDILSDAYQKELEYLSDKIAAFQPEKIFVERTLDEQKGLDEFYQNFDKPYTEISRNEIWQLAMRTAKKLNHDKLYAFDYLQGIQFPYKEMIETMKVAGQDDEVLKNEERLEVMEAKSREEVKEKKTLTQMYLEMNEPNELKKSIDWYLNFCNTAGTLKDTIGVFLTSEWYKRNLFMYSLIQKQVEDKDKRIMVLSGASHTTLQRQFIERNPEWKIVELKTVLE